MPRLSQLKYGLFYCKGGRGGGVCSPDARVKGTVRAHGTGRGVGVASHNWPLTDAPCSLSPSWCESPEHVSSTLDKVPSTFLFFPFFLLLLLSSPPVLHRRRGSAQHRGGAAARGRRRYHPTRGAPMRCLRSAGACHLDRMHLPHLGSVCHRTPASLLSLGSGHLSSYLLSLRLGWRQTTQAWRCAKAGDHLDTRGERTTRWRYRPPPPFPASEHAVWAGQAKTWRKYGLWSACWMPAFPPLGYRKLLL